MALKIRLRQQGRRNSPFYRLVLADARSPRDGKYLENLGWYNPVAKEGEEGVKVHAERIQHWLDQGAELTEKAHALVKRHAPAVIEVLRKREAAKKAKSCEKRRASRKKKEVATA